jgi:hypothetical protein
MCAARNLDKAHSQRQSSSLPCYAYVSPRSRRTDSTKNGKNRKDIYPDSIDLPFLPRIPREKLPQTEISALSLPLRASLMMHRGWGGVGVPQNASAPRFKQTRRGNMSVFLTCLILYLFVSAAAVNKLNNPHILYLVSSFFSLLSCIFFFSHLVVVVSELSAPS